MVHTTLECFSVRFPSFFSRSLFVCILALICIGFAWFCLLFYTHTIYSRQIWLVLFIKGLQLCRWQVGVFSSLLFCFWKCNINILLCRLTFEAIHIVVSKLSGHAWLQLTKTPINPFIWENNIPPSNPWRLIVSQPHVNSLALIFSYILCHDSMV